MLWKVRDVAQRLNCAVSTVYQLVETGELGSFQIGARRGGIRVSDEQVAEYLERCRRSTGAAVPKSLRHLKHIRSS